MAAGPESLAAQGERLPPHRYTAAEAVAELGSDARQGLTAGEVLRRLSLHGRNQLPSEPPAPVWRRFLAQFRDVLTMLLLAATVVSFIAWWFERDAPVPYEALTILAIVLLNGFLGFVQEGKAERALAALRGHGRAERPRAPGWRAAARPDGGARAGRHPPARGGRQRRGRRPGACVDLAPRLRVGPDRREHPGLQGQRSAGRRGGGGRPEQHGLQRDGGRGGAGPRRGHRHRTGHRDRPHRGLAPDYPGDPDPAAEGARSRRQAPGRRGHRHRGGDGGRHPGAGAPPVAVRSRGRAAPGGLPGRRRGAGGPHGHHHHRPVPRHPPAGGAERDHPQAVLPSRRSGRPRRSAPTRPGP